MAISLSRMSRPRQRRVRICAALVLASVIVLPTVGSAAAVQKRVIPQSAAGTVKDALGRPVAGAAMVLRAADGRLVARTTSGEHGQFKLQAPGPGTYELIVHKSGFKDARKVLVLPARIKTPFDIGLESEQALTVAVQTTRLKPQNGLSSTGANKYTMTQRDISELAAGQSTAFNQVMLQMPGVALDQNQEIHVRGLHAGVQYEINGIMLPLNMNADSELTQLFNSHFVKSVSLIDGILPAQYGYRTTGVIAITSKNGCEGNDNNFSILGGQRNTVNPTVELGGCNGNFSYYLTGTYLRSDLGLTSATPGQDAIHDQVNQGQGFAYLTYTINPTTKLSLISGMTVAANQFPNTPGLVPMFTLEGVNPADFPSSKINSSLDQQDYYGVLALNGAIGSNTDYQLAYSTDYNRRNFNPDDIAGLIYEGLAAKIYTTEFSNNMQGDLTYRWGPHTFRMGFYFGEYAIEDDDTSLVFPLVMGVPLTTPVSITSNLNKINLVYGVYFQDTWQLTEKFSVNYGSRWDRVSGLVNDSQFSPTINFEYKVRPDTTVHAGFARYFQVPTFQNVSSGVIALSNTTGGAGPGIPLNLNLDAETDYVWDTGYSHQFTPNLVLTQDSYFRIERHEIDEGEFGYVPLPVPFNYVRGYGAGLENAISYNLENFTLRGNIFVARDEIRGVATGQYNFTPLAQLKFIDGHYIVVDHTPLVGASGGVAYRWHDYQFTFDGLYSAGLRGGFADNQQLPKVWQFNLSASKKFDVPGIGKVENRVILLNIFDRTNLIRPTSGIGVFQAGYGPAITVYDALTIPLPAL
jgi:outer membrane receptor protein involved in Fe transport